MNEDADVSCKRLYVYVCTYIPIQKKKIYFAWLLCEVWLSNWRLWLLFWFFFLYSDCRIVFFLLFSYLHFFYSLFNFFLNWKTAIVQLLLPQFLRHTTGLWFSSRLRYFVCYVPIYTYIHILTLIVKEETSVKTVTNLCRH